MTLFLLQKRTRYFSLAVAACFFSFFLSACGESTPEIPKLKASDVILAFGDSLTSGNGVSSDASYPSVLEQLSGITVINDGISGSLSEEGLLRFESSLNKYKPSLTIIFYGGNDILQNHSLDKLKRNLSSMIELAQAHGSYVVLLGVPKKSLLLNGLPLYSELAEQYKIPLDNQILAKLLKDTTNKSDSVHLNEKGYRLLAERVFTLLKDTGAL